MAMIGGSTLFIDSTVLIYASDPSTPLNRTVVETF